MVPPSLGNLFNKRPVDVATDSKASLTHYSGTAEVLRIPFTLLTVVSPFEANRHLSLQKLRSPFSHNRMGSFSPIAALCAIVPVPTLLHQRLYEIVVSIIDGMLVLSREVLGKNSGNPFVGQSFTIL